MQLHQIDLNLLLVLDAIYAEGSITGAGARLHLTQPAVSHALARLRDLLGDPLFVRSGRHMVQTPLARALMEPLRRALRGLEIALTEAARFEPATARQRFTIGLRDTFEPLVLPPLMRRVARAAPNVRIATARFERRELEAELASGRLDIALDILLPHGDAVRRRRLGVDRMVVVARRRHPRLRGRLDLKTYLSLGHVVASSRRAGPGVEDVALARRGLERDVRLRCQHYYAACLVVEQSDLVLTAPEHSVRVANLQSGNRILPLPFEVPELDVNLYWHANVDDEPANRWLRDQIEAFS